MKFARLLFIGWLLTLSTAAVALPESKFAALNPDIQKYEYARSYIAALKYIKVVHDRWVKSSPKKDLKGASDVVVMRGYVAYLVNDNADLRVSKNYLSSYLTSKNALIKKSADMYIMSCLTVIAINDREKKIWNEWYAVKESGYASRKNETAFLNAQVQLMNKRKEALKGVIEASVLLTKILRSEKNANEKGHLLAITKEQRRKLLTNLDDVDKITLDWGLKPGQDFIAASVAVIREILEDPIYKTLP